jgi:arylsulfatase A-like enzyme
VDDQSPFDFKMYNPKSTLESPTIDKLAEEGMVFESARHMGSWSGAVCTPSRHMIMSGRTLWNLPSWRKQFQNPSAPDSLELQTIGAVFNRAGYLTMRTCKKGNSYPEANAQFSVVRDATKRGGTEETGSAWHGKKVMEYLNDRELKQEKPLPENYLLAHPFFHGHPNLRDEDRVSGVWKRRDEQTVRNEIGREYACSENIDIQLGKVLNKLEAMGELANTYVIYTSDHGIAIGRHGLMGKQNLYEHTWRVPFIVNGPGIKAGSRVEGNIYLLDILPTVCDLAGIEIPSTVNGVSFKPVLMGEKETVREVQYGVYCGGTKPGMRSVMKGDWKLIKYDMMDGAVRETQLFNLADNPHEYLSEHGQAGEYETDLAENPEYAEKLHEMEALLLEQMINNNDPYRLWDQVN